MEVLLRIKEIIESDGKHKFCFTEKDGEILLSDVLNSIASVWNELDKEKQQNKLAKVLLSDNKRYVGDSKYVLYQTICDLGGEDFTIRCGKYAFDKIINMSGFTLTSSLTDKFNDEIKTGWLTLNGEKIRVYRINCLDKKQITITPKCLDIEDLYCDIEEEITLYYA